MSNGLNIGLFQFSSKISVTLNCFRAFYTTICHSYIPTTLSLENVFIYLCNKHDVKTNHSLKTIRYLNYNNYILDTQDESEEGIDNTITVIEMLVDYINGDLVFVDTKMIILGLKLYYVSLYAPFIVRACTMK